MELAERIPRLQERLTDTEIWNALLERGDLESVLSKGLSQADVQKHLGLSVLPGDYGEEYDRAARKHAPEGMDPKLFARLLAAQGYTESKFNPEALGAIVGDLPGTPPRPGAEPRRAKGIAQLMPETAEALGVDPMDPVASIDAQARLMAENVKRYGGDFDKALRAYHGGTDTKNWGKVTNAYPGMVYQEMENFGWPNPAGERLKNDPKWTAFERNANAALLGAGVPLEAAGATLRQTYEDWKATRGQKDAPSLVQLFRQNFSDIYPQAVSYYAGQRETFNKANPLQSGVEETLSATPATMGALALTGGGAPFAGAGITSRLGNAASQGGLIGLIQSGLSDRPLGEDIGIGAAAGVGTTAAGRVLQAPWRRFGGGSVVSPVEAEGANALLNAGVDVYPSQFKGGSPMAKLMERVYGVDSLNQIQQLTAHVARTLGLPGDRITSRVLDPHLDRVGRHIESFANGRIIPGTDQALLNRLGALEQRVTSEIIPDSERNPMLRRIHDLFDEMVTGGISGEQYRNIVGYGSDLNRAIRRDSPIAPYAQELRNAVEEAFGRILPPAELAAYNAARDQYRRGIAVGRIINDGNGLIDPKLLAGTLARSYGSTAQAGQHGALAAGANELLPSIEGASAARTKSAVAPLLGLGILGGLQYVSPDLLARNTAAATSLLAAGYVASRMLNSPLTGLALTRSVLNPAHGPSEQAARAARSVANQLLSRSSIPERLANAGVGF